MLVRFLAALIHLQSVMALVVPVALAALQAHVNVTPHLALERVRALHAARAPTPPLFSVDWFTGNTGVFSHFLIPLAAAAVSPLTLVEVGSFEGRSAAWLIANVIDNVTGSQLHCIDSFAGGQEHLRYWGNAGPLATLEATFDANLASALSSGAAVKHKGNSALQLAALVAAGIHAHFIYIDGSHEAADVLADAVLAYTLARPPSSPGADDGGLIAFDDYLWSDGVHSDALFTPGPAIDAFLSIFGPRVTVVYRSYQLWVRRAAR